MVEEQPDRDQGPGRTTRRPRAVALGVGLAAAGVVALATPTESLHRAGVAHVVDIELSRLVALAGLREGTPLVADVVQEGGPLWVTPILRAAADAEPGIEVGPSRHVIKAEVVRAGPAYAVRLQLWRKGWNLGTPHPVRIRLAPWAVWLSVAVAAVAAAIRRLSLGVAVAIAGGVAQLLAAMLPWPAVLPPQALPEAWRTGLPWVATEAWVRGLPQWSVAVAGGTVALCAILMAFDHRRTPRQGGTLIVSGILGTVGGLLWIEAAVRLGLWAWLTVGWGVAAMVLVGSAWVAARWRRDA